MTVDRRSQSERLRGQDEGGRRGEAELCETLHHEALVAEQEGAFVVLQSASVHGAQRPRRVVRQQLVACRPAEPVARVGECLQGATHQPVEQLRAEARRDQLPEERLAFLHHGALHVASRGQRAFAGFQCVLQQQPQVGLVDVQEAYPDHVVHGA